MKIFVVVVLLAIALVALARWTAAEDAAIASARWMQAAGPGAVVAIAVVYTGAILVLLPVSLLDLAVGFAFGFGWGGLLVMPLCLVGATLAFRLGRGLLRSRVQRRFGRDPRAVSLDQAIGSRGLLLVVLLRLSPVPFSLANYLLSVTSVRTRDFVLGTLVGALPFTLLFVYLGSLAPSAVALVRRGGTHPVELAMLAVGVAAAVAIGFTMMRLLRRAILSAPRLESGHG